jgi:alpha-tubulin suppressor-like RCC1 family protein
LSNIKKLSRKARLLAYSAMSTAVLANPVNSDIRIQTVDITLNFGDSVSIDFDGMGALPGKFTVNFESSIKTTQTTSFASSSTIYNMITATDLLIKIEPNSTNGSVMASSGFGKGMAPNNNVKSSFTNMSTSSPGVARTLYSLSHAPGEGSFSANTAGPFYAGTQKFIGVKFNIDSNTHYGWIEVQYPNQSEFKIKSFAYEDIPNKAISTNHAYGSEISAGQDHTILLDEFVTEVAGSNDFGQKGGASLDAGFQSFSGPDLVTVDSGFNHNIGLDSSGNVWTWGNNAYGQLGLGDDSNRSIAQKVAGLQKVRAIAAGAHHTLALAEDGKLYAWGRNSQHQLGSGNTINASSPLLILTDGNINKLSAGYDHSALIMYDGTLKIWGSNGYGQVGNESSSSVSTPLTVAGNVKFTEVSCGGFHTLAISSGNLYSWGRNDKGQLGLGHYNNINKPTQVGVASGWESASAGGFHSLVQNVTADIYSFGDNSQGQLGMGDRITRNIPTSLSFEGIQGYEAGPYHSGAIDSMGGYYYGWGQNNEDGRIGFPTPKKVVEEPGSIYFSSESSSSSSR